MICDIVLEIQVKYDIKGKVKLTKSALSVDTCILFSLCHYVCVKCDSKYCINSKMGFMFMCLHLQHNAWLDWNASHTSQVYIYICTEL